MNRWWTILLTITIALALPLEAKSSESDKIRQQISEQTALRSQYISQKDKTQKQIEGYRQQLSGMEQKRAAKEAAALKTAQMKIDDIQSHINRIEGEMQGSVNKIVHSELKQTRDDMPDGKARKEKPYSSPSADLSGIKTGSDADGNSAGEDNSTAIMTSGDHEAILREMSPALKFEYLKQLKSQYETVMAQARQEYRQALEKLRATDDFQRMLQAEDEVQQKIAGGATDIVSFNRRIQRQDLRLEGLHQRLAEAMLKEGEITDFAQPEPKTAGGTPDISGQNDNDGCPRGYVRVRGKCLSPFDDGYDDYTAALDLRENDRGQDQADRVAADQTSRGGRKGYTTDDLAHDMDAVQDDLKTECREHSDCPAGYSCENGQCVEKAIDCTGDGDCPQGQICKDGRCVNKPECTKNSDCPQGQTCKNGRCLAPAVQQQASLVISPANKAVVINETVNLKATYTDTQGAAKDVTAQADWSPTAAFSRDKIGVYTVTASHKGLTATSQITVVQEKGMEDITVNQKIVTVTFWDSGKQQDGDMIDILINGEVVFPGITLTFAKQSRTITMNADIIVVGFKALNEGSVPPNTASVTFSAVTAGKATQKYSLKTDQSANMNINYKP